MIKPITVTEHMMYNTAKIITSTGTGTGFFFNFKLTNSEVPVLITNKHVINYNPKETVHLSLHLYDLHQDLFENVSINFNVQWIFHPTLDLCFCFMNPIFTEVKKIFNKNVYYRHIGEELIWDNTKLSELSVIEEVIMVGYPSGISDEINNFPLFRKGITSSHPALDFNNKSIGAVDMACFPGSSGSPIFILNENGYRDKKGTIFLDKSRLVFLGLLFAGPQYTAKGELKIEPIPTNYNYRTEIPIMMNLGYYVKAQEILSFKPMIENYVNSTSFV